jgi:NADP-dependent 3-hydroxy acid dehydrogenase YdfG
MKAFDGKVAVITGGAHGIGQAAPAPGTQEWQNIEGMDFHD